MAAVSIACEGAGETCADVRATMAARGMAAEGLAKQFRQLRVGLWLRQKRSFVLIQRLPTFVGRQRGLQVVSVL